jgi:hypothetical protein
MNAKSHDFVCVDMRSLKAALVARSQAQQVSVSTLVRGAVARHLELTEAAHSTPADATEAGKSTPSRIALRIFMMPADAKLLAARAQEAGLSRGNYLAGLVADVPVLSSGSSRKDHISALITSSAELSTLSRNVYRLTALLRQADAEGAMQYRGMLDSIAGDVHSHLELAARALADLQPRKSGSNTSARTPRRYPGVGRAPSAER